MTGALELAELMVGFLVVQFVTVTAVRSRARKWRGKVGEPAETVRFSVRWRVIPFVGSAFWLLFFLVLSPWTPPIEADDVCWMVIGIGCVLVPLWVVSVTIFGLTVRVGSSGIERHSPWRRQGVTSYVEWNELREVRFSPAPLEMEFFGAQSRVAVPSAMIGSLIPAVQTLAPVGVRERFEQEIDAMRRRAASRGRLASWIRKRP